VREGVGLHGEMDGRMKFEGTITVNLMVDGTVKGLGDFMPEILIVSGFPMLLKGGLEPLLV